jgi:glycosyltransferase involved in cell wall biosynthesis
VALSQARLLFAVTAFDRVCLDQIAPGRVRDLKPFIDASPFAAIGRRDAGVPLRLLVIGMMRNERKLESYRQLAAALALLHDVSLPVTIIGDGTFRSDVEHVLAVPAQRHCIQFVGSVSPSEIPGFMAQADAFAWPGIGEAYGIVFLEAQAAGLPVIACRDRGVPDAVDEDHSALLSEPGDALALARNLRAVVEDVSLRTRLGQRGRAFVMQDRSLEAAARGLGSAIRSVAS